MKKLTIVISIIVLLFTILFLVIPKESFSELENRALEQTPQITFENIIDGNYMNKSEKYINDHFPLKNIFLYLKTSFFKLMGFQEINDVYFGKDNYLIENYPEIDYKDDLIKVINNFSTKVKADIKLMIIPTKIMIYQDKLPSNINYVNQQKEIDQIYSSVNVDTIDILDDLNEAKKNYDLFYKTDHHWTSIGAYFGYKAYRESCNLDFFELNNLKMKEITNSFLGSTYSKVTNYKQEPDKILIFKFINNLSVKYVDDNKETQSLYNFDYLDKKDKYSLFLDNNHSLINIINSDVETGRLLIIKDSFANSMIPLLVNHYHEIDVIDPRYYKRSISKYISENNIEEVLLIYNYGIIATDKNILSIR